MTYCSPTFGQISVIIQTFGHSRHAPTNNIKLLCLNSFKCTISRRRFPSFTSNVSQSYFYKEQKNQVFNTSFLLKYMKFKPDLTEFSSVLQLATGNTGNSHIKAKSTDKQLTNMMSKLVMSYKNKNSAEHCQSCPPVHCHQKELLYFFNIRQSFFLPKQSQKSRSVF